jgi:hypothetical protein
MSRRQLEVSMRARLRSPRPAAVVSDAATSSPDTQRRRFLLTLGVGGAGAAAASVAALPAVAGIDPAGDSDSDARYRETTHVRDYYRTAKL